MHLYFYNFFHHRQLSLLSFTLSSLEFFSCVLNGAKTGGCVYFSSFYLHGPSLVVQLSQHVILLQCLLSRFLLIQCLASLDGWKMFIPVLIQLAFLFTCSAFSQECGRKPSSNGRIVGGEEATPNSWPWQLSLRLFGSHTCGASLLTPQWALTAAHCVQKSSDPKDYKLVFGAHYVKNDGQIIGVSRIIPHAGWNESHYRHDFALLKIARPVKLSPKIQTICLPNHGSPVKPGSKCYISGWGRYDPKLPKTPSKWLKQSRVPLVDRESCVRKNGHITNIDYGVVICVGGQGSTICNGDSGGPLMCEEDGRWVLRGAASWMTSYSCPVDTYSVFARVSTHVNWIRRNMQN